MMTLLTAASVRTPGGVAGDAVLVDNGVVRAVGSSASLRTRDVREIDYPGAVIIPGVRDAHFHPVAYTAALAGLTLDIATSIAEVLDLVRAAASGAGERTLVGLRLDDEALEERRLPTAAEITSATGPIPTVLHRYCGHVAVANEAALALAGIGATTPDPPGGVIDRDPEGSPTGVLRETAIDLVSEACGDTGAVSADALAASMAGLAGLGITSIGAMVRRGGGAWATLGNETDLVATAGPAIPIKLRCYVIADTVADLHDAGARLDEAGPRIRWQGLKRFGDGSLGGHTAAMHEPFADRDTTGTLRLTDKDAVLARAAMASGRDVAIHAIGDLACTVVLDLMEDLAATEGNRSRLRIEHVSVIRTDDVARLARLGIIASVQPPFMGSETGWVEERIGPERMRDTYAFRTLWDAGVTLAGGSDCPVESPDPWSGMALARDRAGLTPAQALSASEAFTMYTAGGAAALGEPEPLAMGSPADLAVVDRDPVEATPDELRRTEVIATYVDGERVDTGAGRPPWPGVR